MPWLRWEVKHGRLVTFMFVFFIKLTDNRQSHWSHLDGDGKLTWADSHLNEEGIEQARTLSRAWLDAVNNDGVPAPETIYTSPLARCLETTRLVFENLMRERGQTFRPVVKESLRERLTDHTCDRRSSRTWITEHYPDYIIDPDFTEEDELWRADRRETHEEHQARKQQLLEDIFGSDENTFIALTTHSYAISAILGVLEMRQFRVREGSSFAVLVKAEEVSTDAPP